MKHFLLIGIMLMNGLAFSADAADKLTWLTFDSPPAYFLSGDQKGTGMCDVAQTALKNQLSTVEHAELQVTSGRQLLDLLGNTTDSSYCMACVGLSPERYPNILFSQLARLTAPAGIVIRKADQAQFAASPTEPASLATMLQNAALVGGIIKGMPYGEQITPLLKQYAGQPNLYEHAAPNMVELYQMLLTGKVNYLLDFGNAFAFASQSLTPEEQQQLFFLPLAEASSPQPAYIACNMTPMNQQIMAQINAALLTEEYKNAVAQRIADFLPENLREGYRKLNMEQIGQ